MEQQRITLKIAGKEYELKVKSPEAEQLMRLAAEDINAMFDHYNASYPDKSEFDKLAFVSLTQAVSKIKEQRSAAKLASDFDNLDELLGNYLAATEQNR